MLICHCNLITEREIEATITELLDEDAWQLIVPAKVYHCMAKRGRCCGCFPNVVETIIRVTEAYHAKSAAEAADMNIVLHLDRVRELRNQFGRNAHERRQTSHRAA
jgi:bacterioferritin-associated ferredoxin